MSKIIDYVEAIGRNDGEELNHSHLYAIDENGEYWPMCIYGWNRSDGESFSILRGHIGARGTCKICLKRKAAGKEPIYNAVDSHKTKWL
jgi:hypothetical protein